MRKVHFDYLTLNKNGEEIRGLHPVNFDRMTHADIFDLIILSGALAERTLTRYGPYIAYLVRGFTPPRSLFVERSFTFDPKRGEIYRKHFQKAYGPFGEDLVATYGRGFSKEQLIKHGLL